MENNCYEEGYTQDEWDQKVANTSGLIIRGRKRSYAKQSPEIKEPNTKREDEEFYKYIQNRFFPVPSDETLNKFKNNQPQISNRKPRFSFLEFIMDGRLTATILLGIAAYGAYYYLGDYLGK
ncbi:MAG: hypothetical protein AABX48_01365 [Nanoarchaeota archaeon]|mgnify:CR=1 FL=1